MRRWDRPLTDLEVNGVVYAMIIGGLETTQYALEEAAQLICDRPGLWHTLQAKPTLIRNFVEESMRLRSPTQGLSTRLTAYDEIFQGVKVPKGSLLHLRFGAGNVDPDEWDCPFDLNLAAQGAHPPFGVLSRPESLPRRRDLAARTKPGLGDLARALTGHSICAEQYLRAPARHYAGDPRPASRYYRR